MGGFICQSKVRFLCELRISNHLSLQCLALITLENITTTHSNNFYSYVDKSLTILKAPQNPASLIPVALGK